MTLAEVHKQAAREGIVSSGNMTRAAPAPREKKVTAGGEDSWATVGAKRGATGAKPPPLMSRQATAPASSTKQNSFAAFEKTKREKDPKEERKEERKKKVREEEDEPVKDKRRSK